MGAEKEEIGVQMAIKDKASEEAKRLTRLLFDYGVSEKRIKLLEHVIENVAWMKAKLDDTREQIRDTSVAIPYDNGGGQKGIRENPLFKGYSALWKSYMSGMNTIMATLPKEAVESEADRIEQPKTVLELVRERHKGA